MFCSLRVGPCVQAARSASLLRVYPIAHRWMAAPSSVHSTAASSPISTSKPESISPFFSPSSSSSSSSAPSSVSPSSSVYSSISPSLATVLPSSYSDSSRPPAISLKKPETLNPFFEVSHQQRQQPQHHQQLSSSSPPSSSSSSSSSLLSSSTGIGPAEPATLNPFFQSAGDKSATHRPKPHKTQPHREGPAVIMSSAVDSDVRLTASHAPVAPSVSFDVSVPSTSPSTSSSSSSSSSPSASDQTETKSQSENNDSSVRESILKTALMHVPALGWTQEALVAAAEELQLSSSVTGMFSRGPVELVEYFVKKANADLSRKLAESKDLIQDMRTVDKLKTAIRLRLQMQIPYSASWSQALALGALPQNLPNTLNNIAELVDEIWHITGDRATDINWYTKRGLLGAVYASTELYMLTDQSENYKDTWTFLERRLDDAVTFGKLPANVSAGLNQIMQFAGANLSFFNRK